MFVCEVVKEMISLLLWWFDDDDDNNWLCACW